MYAGRRGVRLDSARLLDALAAGEASPAELAARLECSVPTARRHLARLAEDGLVVNRRAGRTTLWRPVPAPAAAPVAAEPWDLPGPARVLLPEHAAPAAAGVPAEAWDLPEPALVLVPEHADSASAFAESLLAATESPPRVDGQLPPPPAAQLAQALLDATYDAECTLEPDRPKADAAATYGPWSAMRELQCERSDLDALVEAGTLSREDTRDGPRYSREQVEALRKRRMREPTQRLPRGL